MDYNQSSVLYLNNTANIGNTTLYITNLPLPVPDISRSYVFTIVGNHYGGIIDNIYINGTAAANKRTIYFNGGNATVLASFPITSGFSNYYSNIITVQQIGLLGNVSSPVETGIALSSVSFFTP
jgi:hypothetical protein